MRKWMKRLAIALTACIACYAFSACRVGSNSSKRDSKDSEGTSIENNMFESITNKQLFEGGVNAIASIIALAK